MKAILDPHSAKKRRNQDQLAHDKLSIIGMNLIKKSKMLEYKHDFGIISEKDRAEFHEEGNKFIASFKERFSLLFDKSAPVASGEKPIHRQET